MTTTATTTITMECIHTIIIHKIDGLVDQNRRQFSEWTEAKGARFHEVNGFKWAGPLIPYGINDFYARHTPPRTQGKKTQRIAHLDDSHSHSSDLAPVKHIDFSRIWWSVSFDIRSEYSRCTTTKRRLATTTPTKINNLFICFLPFRFVSIDSITSFYCCSLRNLFSAAIPTSSCPIIQVARAVNEHALTHCV